MNKKNKTATFDISLMILDVLVVILMYLVSIFLYYKIQGNMLLLSHSWTLVVFVMIFSMSMFINRMYNTTTFYYIDRIITRTLLSTALAAFAITFVAFILQKDQTSRLFYVFFCAFVFVGVNLYRIALRIIAKSGHSIGKLSTLFVGRPETYKQYSAYLDKTAIKSNIVAYLDFADDVLGTTEKFEHYLIEKCIDEVAFDYSHELAFDYKPYLRVCEDMGVTVRLVLNLFDMPKSQTYINSIGTYPVVTYHSINMSKDQLFLKSCMDIVGAFLGLVLVSPIMLVTAIAIKLDSPGPVFFVQKRAGLNGKTFNLIKFRSMQCDAEEQKEALQQQNKMSDGMMFKMENDPRVTKIGAFIRKTSIDELPQLINVLKGDMSLVGTRPPTLDEVEKYERIHRRRISIKPGITGMWQVSGRSDIEDFNDVVKLDTSYIDKWSIGLDIKLLLRTVQVVISKKGSY